MSEDKRGFAVTDRRHFTADGAAKTDVEPERPGAPSNREQAPSDRGQAGDAPAGAELPVDFASFLFSLGAQASFLLNGGEAHAPDLEGARSMIGILEMLQDKTEGRRTPEEDQILEGILYELRMGYLARTRADGA